MSAIGFESLPAVGQLSISSPPLLAPFAAMNRRKRYRNQVKPFNFLSTCHVRPFGHPYGCAPEHFQLIAPYERDSRRWLKMAWIDRYSSNTFRISTTGDHGDRETARVKTYGEVIEEYAFHPESKCADADGRPSGKQTENMGTRKRKVTPNLDRRTQRPTANTSKSRTADSGSTKTRLALNSTGQSIRRELACGFVVCRSRPRVRLAAQAASRGCCLLRGRCLAE